MWINRFAFYFGAVVCTMALYQGNTKNAVIACIMMLIQIPFMYKRNKDGN